MEKLISSDSCFLMDDCSVKRARDLKIGDSVISSRGEIGEVEEISSVQTERDVFFLESKNNLPLILLEEDYLSGSIFQTKTNGLKAFKGQISQSPISDYKSGDLICSPALNKQISGNLTPEQASLLGYFAAEGSFSKKYGKRQGLVFTLGIGERLIAQKIQELFHSQFPSSSVKINHLPDRSVIILTATGAGLADFFHYHVGEYSHQKKLSGELVFSSQECKASFLAAWLEGDGCLVGDNRLVGITSSPHLAWQTKMMLNSLNISSSIREKKSSGKVRIKPNYPAYPARNNFRIEIYAGDSQKLFPSGSSKYRFHELSSKKINQFFQTFSLHFVKNIKKQKIHGIFYNVKVSNISSCIINGVNVG